MHKKILIKKMTIDSQPVKLELKAIPVSVKVVDATEGIIEAYVSVFGNVDSYGDVVVKGAFARAVAEFNANGRYPKGVMHHDWTRPVAKTIEMREDDTGLYIKGKLVLKVQDAAEAFELLKEGVITDFSFGYSVRDYEYNVEEGIRYIKDIAIYEWSPVLVGANDLATLIGVKSADVEFEEAEKTDVVPEAVEAPADEDPKEDEATDETATEDETTETPKEDEAATGDENNEGTEGSDEAPQEDESQKSTDGTDETKAGRTISAANEGLIRTAMDALDAVVEQAKNTRKMFEELLSSLEQPNGGKSNGGQSARSNGTDPNLIKGLKIQAKQAIKAGNAMIVHIKKIEGK